MVLLVTRLSRGKFLKCTFVASATTICCDQKPQHLRRHIKAIGGDRSPRITVSDGHIICEVTERLFVSIDRSPKVVVSSDHRIC